MGVPIRMQCRFSKDPEDPNEPVCRRRKDAIIGKCDSCQEIFCSEHRFIETHDCKQQEYVSPPGPLPRAKVRWWMVGLDDHLLRECCGDDPKAALANMRTLADKTEALCGERRATSQGAHSGCEDIDEFVWETTTFCRVSILDAANTADHLPKHAPHHTKSSTSFEPTIPTPHQGRMGTGRLSD